MLIERIAGWGEATFQPPAGLAALSAVEAQLGHVLPNDLALVLSESNGIQGELGEGLIWDLDRIGRDNALFRTNEDFADLYMPFDGLVFFADSGVGDQFALSLRGNCEVYVWDHDNDSRTWIAPSVMRYLEGWMTGAIDH